MHTHTHTLTRARAPAAAHTHPAALPSSSQVTFPVDLDVYDFCSDELRKELEGPRAALKEWEDEQVGRLRTILSRLRPRGPRFHPAATPFEVFCAGP